MWWCWADSGISICRGGVWRDVVRVGGGGVCVGGGRVGGCGSVCGSVCGFVCRGVDRGDIEEMCVWFEVIRSCSDGSGSVDANVEVNSAWGGWVRGHGFDDAVFQEVGTDAQAEINQPVHQCPFPRIAPASLLVPTAHEPAADCGDDLKDHTALCHPGPP